MTADGLEAWAGANPGQMQIVDSAVYSGCGLTRDGLFRHAGRAAPRRLRRPRDPVEQRARRIRRRHRADPGRADRGRRPPAPVRHRWRAPGDPLFDAYLEQKMLEAVDIVLADGVTPVWLTSPDIEPPDGDVSRDPARMARFNELFARRGTRPSRPATRRPRALRRDVARRRVRPRAAPRRGALQHRDRGFLVAPWLMSAIRRSLATVPLPR